MTSISFGPSSAPWTYTPSTETYALSPTSPKNLTIATTAGVDGVSFSIDPATTALVIVDMQNFFLDATCMSHPRGLEAVDPLIKVIERCRSEGIRIIWLNWGLTDSDLQTMPAGVQRGFMKAVLHPNPSSNPSYLGLGADLGGSKGRCLVAGSWNADIYPPLKALVQENDIHCAKDRMSGLWHAETELGKVLRGEGIQTMLFAGVNTDQCVLGTLVDAYNMGINCVLIDDCCGTPTKYGRESSAHNISNSYGFVTDSAALLASKTS